jgi:O-acetyl-ADP-ribose deacetylase (regulator of RNase III)
MTIRYLKGDASDPQAKGKKIIAHVCNDQGGWGAGFVLAISKRWKEPEEDYRQWCRKGDDFALGNIHVVQTSRKDISVANMVAQKGFGGVAIKYDKLRECLAKLCEVAKQQGASVHMPRIGCGLAGGSWNKVEPIIEEELCNKGVEVTVYDFGN